MATQARPTRSRHHSASLRPREPWRVEGVLFHLCHLLSFALMCLRLHQTVGMTRMDQRLQIQGRKRLRGKKFYTFFLGIGVTFSGSSSPTP